MKFTKPLLAAAALASALTAMASPAAATTATTATTAFVGEWVLVCTYDRKTLELKECEWVYEP
jgi:invasion protein IalB